jgi:hypothetical protein
VAEEACFLTFVLALPASKFGRGNPSPLIFTLKQYPYLTKYKMGDIVLLPLGNAQVCKEGFFVRVFLGYL